MVECLARQPIFTNKLQIYGYELLYRSNSPSAMLNAFPGCEADEATSSVLANSMFLFGIEKLTRGKLAFVNFSQRMLVSDVVSFLPPKQIVVEVLENVEPDALTLAACEKLKAAGYKIVLDDFVYHPKMDPLIDIADIIKIDFLASSPSYCEAITKQFQRKKDLVFLAEKIETYDQYHQAIAWGYTLFQGYFFCKPLRLDARDIQGSKLVCFKLLKELNDPHVEVKKIEAMIQRDLGLSYKILKYINSAAYGFVTKISSIKQAVAMLGNEKLAKIITIVLMTGLGEGKPGELVTTALTRGRFAERIAEETNLKPLAGEAFLCGMFSLMEALLDQPLQKILQELPLEESIARAIQFQPGKLTPVLQAVIAYEQADWDRYALFRQAIGLNDETAKKLYMEAVSCAMTVE